MATDGNYFGIQIESDELHGRLGKGIPKSSFMLITGDDSAGKSILTQRLIYSFITEGNSVTLLSTELTTGEFINQMESLKYSVVESMLNEKLLFIPMFPRLGHTVPRSDFLERVMGSEKLFNSDVIILDTLSNIISERYTPEDYFKFISFLKKLTAKGKLVILTADQKFVDQKLLTVPQSTCDIHFELIITQVGAGLKRFIKVKRFKGGLKQVGELIGFRVEPGVGFVIEISGVA